jgi:gluconolactonase
MSYRAVRQPMWVGCALAVVLTSCFLWSRSHAQDVGDIPHGTVTKYSWTASKIYPGTRRDYWVYVPAQYNEREPACVMVFQDGGGYVDPKSSWNTAAVFDELIHRKEMPVTIGIFVNPGQIPPLTGEGKPRSNRSVEYDSLGDRYARFLIEEILPEVGKQYRLKQDGNSHAIAGASSGAIAAFTVAWERPDAFSRVFSTIGSFVAFRGGHEYIPLIRKTEHKPLRIFLQSGTHDMNVSAGAWWFANQDMLDAFNYSAYDVRYEWGEGGHDSKHGSKIFADVLRWLWRDYPSPITTVGTSRQPLSEILLPNESWQPVAKDHTVGGITANADGDLVFTDTTKNRLYTLSSDDDPRLSSNEHATAMGRLAAGRDQLLVAEPATKRIASFDAAGHRTVVGTNLSAHHLAVTSSGRLYATDKSARQIWSIDETRRARAVDHDLKSPAGLQLSLDEHTLFVSDPHERLVYAYQIQADGALTNKLPYCYLHVPANELESGADGMTIDANGRLFVATTLGVQVCEQEGRSIGIITFPRDVTVTQVTFGGKTHDVLYAVSSNGTLLRRKVQTENHPRFTF